MAFNTAIEVVQYFESMLQARLIGIERWYLSEQALVHVDAYPAIFILCPRFQITEWFTPDYLDVNYTIVIGAIVLDQDTEQVRIRLYTLIDEIITALVEDEQTSDYTYVKGQQNFRANFGPIFTNQTDTFIGDAQVEVPIQRKVII